ncbi:37S ribosomal protein S24, mitochondrial [Pseudocyphellaria aurata]|nr:37S ribosomal protein S24, mitochondrial [Pseudocyphellaria aurata]
MSPLASRLKSFHTSTIHRHDDPKERMPYVFDVSSLSSQARDHYNTLSAEEKFEFRETSKKVHEHMTSHAVESKLQQRVSQELQDAAREEPPINVPSPRFKLGFFASYEDDPYDVGSDEDFEGDDMTSIAHGQLEQHREIREYMRIAAWEMPMLSKLAKPFSPPPLDHPLRFRYTTYMGETHPAAKKIVLEFCVRDLPGLTEDQRVKFVKLVGPRYNPETDLVKMSCEMFETQAQNKRYLGDLVDTLMIEAQDDTDRFEDVPLDFRHHKYKPKVEFPNAWKLTKERKQRLDMDRGQRLLAEREREKKGQISEGSKIIEAWLQAGSEQEPTYIAMEIKKLQGRVKPRGRSLLR